MIPKIFFMNQPYQTSNQVSVDGKKAPPRCATNPDAPNKIFKYFFLFLF